MWKRAFGLLLMGSAHLFSQNSGCYMPEGQTVYSEMCCSAPLYPPDCPQPCCLFPVLFVDIQGGIRRDSFSFSVRGPNGVPSTHLRQKYTKIKSATGSLNAWFQVNPQWYMRGYADYASITHGTEKQSFYDSTGALAHHYRQQAHSGYLYDFSGGIGYIFPCFLRPFTLAAVGGYSQEEQHIQSRKNKRHSKLKLSWTGPWAGADIALRYEGIKVSGTCEYHWAWFRGTENQTAGGSCNTHCHTTNKLRANGQGIVAILSVTQIFCHNWRFGFAGKAQWWRTNDGHYSEDGTSLRLRRVHWNSGSLVADLGYRF